MTGRCVKTIGKDSPFGPVHPNEVVTRVVSNPIHIGKEGVKASAIPNGHLLSGLSVNRMGLLSKIEFENIANFISSSIPPGTHKPAGVLQATVTDILAFVDFKEDQALCVFDDPEEGPSPPKNDAHAVVIVAEVYDEAEIVRIKTELLDNVFTRHLVFLSDLTHPS